MAGYGTFGDSRRRRRHQALWRVVRFVFGLMAVLGVGVYGYQVGISAGHARSEQLEADLARFQRANLELGDRMAVVDQRSEAAEAALDEHASAHARVHRRCGRSAGAGPGPARCRGGPGAAGVV